MLFLTHRFLFLQSALRIKRFGRRAQSSLDDFATNDVARREAAPHAVLAAAASRFTAAVKPRDHLARKVNNLTLAVDAKTCIRVMRTDRAP